VKKYRPNCRESPTWRGKGFVESPRAGVSFTSHTTENCGIGGREKKYLPIGKRDAKPAAADTGNHQTT
jgi:hypothetical protein